MLKQEKKRKRGGGEVGNVETGKRKKKRGVREGILEQEKERGIVREGILEQEKERKIGVWEGIMKQEKDQQRGGT